MDGWIDGWMDGWIIVRTGPITYPYDDHWMPRTKSFIVWFWLPERRREMLISSCYIFKMSSIFVSCNKTTFFCGWIWGMWELGLGQPLSTHTHTPPILWYVFFFFFLLLRDFLQTSTTLLFANSIHYTYQKHQHFFFFPLYFQVNSKLEFCLVSLSLIYLIFIKKIPFILLHLLKFERSSTTYASQISKDPIL
jgi:hypothetical protein